MKKEMQEQELLDLLIFETFKGTFGVSDISEHDQPLGYYDTYEEAKNACLNQLK